MKVRINGINSAQVEWLAANILAGLTDSEIAARFTAQFDGGIIPKSSIARCRAIAGEQLVRKFWIARRQSACEYCGSRKEAGLTNCKHCGAPPTH
jgi:hypothetical protein